MRNKIIETIEKEKIIVIVRGVPKEKLVPLGEAMYNGGIRLIEITYSLDKSTSDEETAANIKMLAEHFKGRMYVGAGTVATVEQVELTHKAGGSFIISPDTYDSVIKRTRELEMVSMPGALTPSEVRLACRSGADFVKLFPITSLGIEYVKAIKAPLSDVKMLAVGGVNLDNMPEYLKIGISGFGLGSNIVDKKLIENEEYDKITELAKKYTEIVKNV